MTTPFDRRLSALGSLARLQNARVEEARQAKARALDAMDRANEALREAASCVAEVEASLRSLARVDSTLALDAWERWQRHLVERRDLFDQHRREQGRVGARLEEVSEWLAHCHRELKATERLVERSRALAALEERRRSARDVDELWLLRREGKS